MDEHSWQRPRDGVSTTDHGVRWRRRGAAAELRFETPARDPVWRQPGGDVESIPLWNAIAAGGLTGGAVALGAGYALPWLGTLIALPTLPAWLGLAVGAVAVPLAAGTGWLAGLRQRALARIRKRAEQGVADSLGEAFGIDLGSRGARQLVDRTLLAMRTGEPQRAHILTARGHGVFRIEPIEPARVLVEPVRPDHADAPGLVGWLSRAVSMTASPRGGVSAEAESRRELLEQRLDRIRAAGGIDPRHARWPEYVTLAVDRMTEFRTLAARAEHLDGLPGEEARATVRRLVADLDEVLELLRAGADALEREVLDESVRESDAHLRFLREKYAAADAEHRRRAG